MTTRARRRAIGYQAAGGVLVASGTAALFGSGRFAPVGSAGLLAGTLTALAGWLMVRHPRVRPEAVAPAPAAGGGRRDTLGRQFTSASASRMPTTGKRIMFAGLVFGDAAMIAVGYDARAGAGLGIWAGLVLATGLGVYLYGRAKRAGHVRPKLKRFDTPTKPGGTRPPAGLPPALPPGGGPPRRRSTHGGIRSRKRRPPAGGAGPQPGGLLMPWPGGAVRQPWHPAGTPVAQRWATRVAPRYPGVEFVPVVRTPVKGPRRRRLMFLGFMVAVGGSVWATSESASGRSSGPAVAAFGLLLFLLGTFRRRIG